MSQDALVHQPVAEVVAPRKQLEVFTDDLCGTLFHKMEGFVSKAEETSAQVATKKKKKSAAKIEKEKAKEKAKLEKYKQEFTTAIKEAVAKGEDESRYFEAQQFADELDDLQQKESLSVSEIRERALLVREKQEKLRQAKNALEVAKAGDGSIVIAREALGEARQISDRNRDQLDKINRTAKFRRQIMQQVTRMSDALQIMATIATKKKEILFSISVTSEEIGEIKNNLERNQTRIDEEYTEIDQYYLGKIENRQIDKDGQLTSAELNGALKRAYDFYDSLSVDNIERKNFQDHELTKEAIDAEVKRIKKLLGELKKALTKKAKKETEKRYEKLLALKRKLEKVEAMEKQNLELVQVCIKQNGRFFQPGVAIPEDSEWQPYVAPTVFQGGANHDGFFNKLSSLWNYGVVESPFAAYQENTGVQEVHDDAVAVGSAALMDPRMMMPATTASISISQRSNRDSQLVSRNNYKKILVLKAEAGRFKRACAYIVNGVYNFFRWGLWDQKYACAMHLAIAETIIERAGKLLEHAEKIKKDILRTSKAEDLTKNDFFLEMVEKLVDAGAPFDLQSIRQSVMPQAGLDSANIYEYYLVLQQISDLFSEQHKRMVEIYESEIMPLSGSGSAHIKIKYYEKTQEIAAKFSAIQAIIEAVQQQSEWIFRPRGEKEKQIYNEVRHYEELFGVPLEYRLTCSPDIILALNKVAVDVEGFESRFSDGEHDISYSIDANGVCDFGDLLRNERLIDLALKQLDIIKPFYEDESFEFCTMVENELKKQKLRINCCYDIAYRQLVASLKKQKESFLQDPSSIDMQALIQRFYNARKFFSAYNNRNQLTPKQRDEIYHISDLRCYFAGLVANGYFFNDTTQEFDLAKIRRIERIVIDATNCRDKPELTDAFLHLSDLLSGDTPLPKNDQELKALCEDLACLFPDGFNGAKNCLRSFAKNLAQRKLSSCEAVTFINLIFSKQEADALISASGTLDNDKYLEVLSFVEAYASETSRDPYQYEELMHVNFEFGYLISPDAANIWQILSPIAIRFRFQDEHPEWFIKTFKDEAIKSDVGKLITRIRKRKLQSETEKLPIDRETAATIQRALQLTHPLFFALIVRFAYLDKATEKANLTTITKYFLAELRDCSKLWAFKKLDLKAKDGNDVGLKGEVAALEKHMTQCIINLANARRELPADDQFWNVYNEELITIIDSLSDPDLFTLSPQFADAIFEYGNKKSRIHFIKRVINNLNEDSELNFASILGAFEAFINQEALLSYRSQILVFLKDEALNESLISFIKMQLTRIQDVKKDEKLQNLKQLVYFLQDFLSDDEIEKILKSNCGQELSQIVQGYWEPSKPLAIEMSAEQVHVQVDTEPYNYKLKLNEFRHLMEVLASTYVSGISAVAKMLPQDYYSQIATFMQKIASGFKDAKFKKADIGFKLNALFEIADTFFNPEYLALFTGKETPELFIKLVIETVEYHEGADPRKIVESRIQYLDDLYTALDKTTHRAMFFAYFNKNPQIFKSIIYSILMNLFYDEKMSSAAKQQHIEKLYRLISRILNNRPILTSTLFNQCRHTILTNINGRLASSSLFFYDTEFYLTKPEELDSELSLAFLEEAMKDVDDTKFNENEVLCADLSNKKAEFKAKLEKQNFVDNLKFIQEHLENEKFVYSVRNETITVLLKDPIAAFGEEQLSEFLKIVLQNISHVDSKWLLDELVVLVNSALISGIVEDDTNELNELAQQVRKAVIGKQKQNSLSADIAQCINKLFWDEHEQPNYPATLGSFCKSFFHIGTSEKYLTDDEDNITLQARQYMKAFRAEIIKILFGLGDRGKFITETVESHKDEEDSQVSLEIIPLFYHSPNSDLQWKVSDERVIEFIKALRAQLGDFVNSGSEKYIKSLDVELQTLEHLVFHCADIRTQFQLFNTHFESFDVVKIQEHKFKIAKSLASKFNDFQELGFTPTVCPLLWARFTINEHDYVYFSNPLHRKLIETLASHETLPVWELYLERLEFLAAFSKTLSEIQAGHQGDVPTCQNKANYIKLFGDDVVVPDSEKDILANKVIDHFAVLFDKLSLDLVSRIIEANKLFLTKMGVFDLLNRKVFVFNEAKKLEKITSSPINGTPPELGDSFAQLFNAQLDLSVTDEEEFSELLEAQFVRLSTVLSATEFAQLVSTYQPLLTKLNIFKTVSDLLTKLQSPVCAEQVIEQLAAVFQSMKGTDSVSWPTLPAIYDSLSAKGQFLGAQHLDYEKDGEVFERLSNSIRDLVITLSPADFNNFMQKYGKLLDSFNLTKWVIKLRTFHEEEFGSMLRDMGFNQSVVKTILRDLFNKSVDAKQYIDILKIIVQRVLHSALNAGDLSDSKATLFKLSQILVNGNYITKEQFNNLIKPILMQFGNRLMSDFAERSRLPGKPLDYPGTDNVRMVVGFIDRLCDSDFQESLVRSMEVYKSKRSRGVIQTLQSSECINLEVANKIKKLKYQLMLYLAGNATMFSQEQVDEYGLDQFVFTDPITESIESKIKDILELTNHDKQELKNMMFPLLEQALLSLMTVCQSSVPLIHAADPRIQFIKKYDNHFGTNYSRLFTLTTISSQMKGVGVIFECDKATSSSVREQTSTDKATSSSHIDGVGELITSKKASPARRQANVADVERFTNPRRRLRISAAPQPTQSAESFHLSVCSKMPMASSIRRGRREFMEMVHAYLSPTQIDAQQRYISTANLYLAFMQQLPRDCSLRSEMAKIKLKKELDFLLQGYFYKAKYLLTELNELIDQASSSGAAIQSQKINQYKNKGDILLLTRMLSIMKMALPEYFDSANPNYDVALANSFKFLQCICMELKNTIPNANTVHQNNEGFIQLSQEKYWQPYEDRKSDADSLARILYDLKITKLDFQRSCLGLTPQHAEQISQLADVQARNFLLGKLGLAIKTKQTKSPFIMGSVAVAGRVSVGQSTKTEYQINVVRTPDEDLISLVNSALHSKVNQTQVELEKQREKAIEKLGGLGF